MLNKEDFGQRGQMGKALVVIVVIIIAVAGVYMLMSGGEEAPPDNQDNQDGDQTEAIVIGTTDSITNFDPAKAYDFFTWELFMNIGRTLLTYEPGTTELQDGIATDYTVSDDGTSYTFTLKEDLEFSDGEPLDAQAVKWSIDRVSRLNLDPSFLVTGFVDNVVVVSEYKVRFNLKKPVSYFPQLVATAPYTPISPETFPENEVSEPTTGYYGPYMVEEWRRGESVTLVENPDYEGPEVKNSTVYVRFYKNSSTMRMALESGEIDVAWKSLNPSDVNDLRGQSGLEIQESPGPYIRYIILRCNQEPFNNENLRRAVEHAVDREEICSVAYENTHDPLYSMVPMGMWSHIDAYPERDLEKSQEYLTAEGYSQENKFEFTLWYTPTHYGDKEADVASILKSSLEETGMMKVNLESAEWATYAGEYLAQGTMPSLLLGWYPDYVDPDDYTRVFLHSDHSGSLGVFYDNPEMDNILEAASTAQTMEKRTELYEEAQELMAEEAPMIPFSQGKLHVGAQSEIEGIVLDPLMKLRYWLIHR